MLNTDYTVFSLYASRKTNYKGQRIMAIKPLALIITETIKEDPKNNKSATKEIKQLPVERNGFLWIETQPNKGNWEGKYAFDADTYKLEIQWAIGHIDSAGHKWLVGSFKNWEELFEIKWSVRGNPKGEGKFEWPDHPDLEQIKTKWQEQGSLTAILVDDIPQLVMLVEAIATKHVVFNDGGYTVYRKLNPDKATFEKVFADIVEQANFEYQPSKRGNNPLTELHKKYLAENSWVYMCFEMQDLEDVEFPTEPSPISVHLNDDGFIEKVTLDWNPPEIKEKKAWANSGGSKGQAEKEILAEREAYILERLGVSSIDELIEKYPSSRTKLDIVMSIATTSDWKSSLLNTDFSSAVATSANNGSTKQVGNTQAKQSAVDSGYTVNHSVQSVSATPVNALTEQVSSATTLKENIGELYLSKILQLKEDGTHKFPKELDAQYLAQQGNEWCIEFYAILQGTILDKTPYGKDARLTRGVNALISQKFGKQLYQLDIKELQELSAMSEFKEWVDVDSLPL